MDIEKFSDNPRCTKCGASQSYKTYKAVFDGYDHIRGSYRIPEHLELTCGSCGYVWKMKCIDQDIVE